MHTPAWQTSVRVHAFWSLQAVPSGAAGFEQTPVLGSHVPAAWHGSEAPHTTGFAPVHAPAWHASVCVHAFWSSQAVPSGAAGFEQTPVLGSHVPAAWHGSEAPHTTGFAPVHAPAWHASVCVHAFWSSQAVPSGAAGFEQSPVV
jgi:hypothetical protein